MTRRLADVTTLVFDVMGTVVDIEGSIAAQAATALQGSGVGEDRLAHLLEEWDARLGQGMDEIIAGEAPWRSHRTRPVARLGRRARRAARAGDRRGALER